MQDHPQHGIAVLGDLGIKIDQLSDDDLIKIAALLEGGADDPKALKGRAILRPRLRVLRPARRLNARRVLCIPFEMMLSDDQAPEDPVYRIPRAAIWPLWSLLAARLSSAIVRDVEQEAATARSILDEGMHRAAAALWKAAAGAIDADQSQMAAQVGELQWLREIAGALRAHKAITAIRGTLKGGGIAKLSDALVQELAVEVRAAVELSEDAGFAAAIAASAHFRSPAATVGALVGAGLGPGPGQRVARRLCEALGGGMDREIAALQSSDAAASPGTVVSGMANLVDSLQAMQSFAKRAKDPELKRKAEQAMLAARNATVDEVLPRMRTSVDSNLDRAVDEALSGSSINSSQAVESNLAALRKAKPSAEFLGVGKELETAVADLLGTVREKAASPVEGESDDERQTRMMVLARFVELLEGADAAQACLEQWLLAKAA